MIDGATNSTIASGRAAITAASTTLFNSVRTKQGAGTVVETAGNVDAAYMVSEFELEFYHVRLRITDGSTNFDVIAKFTPAEYTSITGRNGFDNFTTATILHNPTLIVPTTADLSASSIAEGNDIGATIAVIESDGTDATFTLGGTDAANFKISGNLLQAAISYVQATKASHAITITATNGAGNSGPLAKTITITT